MLGKEAALQLELSGAGDTDKGTSCIAGRKVAGNGGGAGAKGAAWLRSKYPNWSTATQLLLPLGDTHSIRDAG